MTDPMNSEAPAEAPGCPKCGGAMWDNTMSKRNPRAPDYKCKDASCGGVIWPKRAPGAAPAAAAPTGPVVPHEGTPDDPACPVCGGRMWDDRASKRNPRAPDFKCRNKPREIGGPGCPGVIWPPREGSQRAAPASGAPRRSSTPAPPPMPEREFSDDEAPVDEDLPF